MAFICLMSNPGSILCGDAADSCGDQPPRCGVCVASLKFGGNPWCAEIIEETGTECCLSAPRCSFHHRLGAVSQVKLTSPRASAYSAPNMIDVIDPSARSVVGEPGRWLRFTSDMSEHIFNIQRMSHILG